MIFTLLVFFCTNCSEAVKRGKPLPPVKLKAVLLNDPSVDGKAEIEITVESIIDTMDVTVVCDLPEGLKLSMGEKEWKGKITRNEKKFFYYKVPVTANTYYRIEFRARIEGEGLKASSSGVVEINSPRGEIDKPKTKVIKILPDGRKVIEMKGE